VSSARLGAVALLVALAVPASSAVARSGCTAKVGGTFEVVLGRAHTPRLAKELRAHVRAIGFGAAVVAQDAPSDYPVVLYGLRSRGQAAGVAAEARKAGLSATERPNSLDACTDAAGDWELVFGDAASVAAARRLAARVTAGGLGKPIIESDGPTDFEVEVDGIESVSQFHARERAAERVVPVASFEPS
jgi:hypothetical protein